VQGPHGSRRGAALVLRDVIDEQPARPSLRTVSSPQPARPTQEPPRVSAVAAAARRPAGGFRVFPLYLGMIAAALVTGFVFKDQLKIEAEEGVGYWLGIAGVGCVGLLLLYPVRKRLPKLGFLGSVPGWFHLHMALGILAPTLILFHAGFRTGSVNAAVALVAMLIVAGSGLFGRMLYVRIHRNLTGKKAEVKAMAQDTALLRQTLCRDFSEVADITEKLEKTLHTPRPNVFRALGYAIATSARITVARKKMLRALARGAKRMASTQPGGKAAARRLRRDGALLVRTYCHELRHTAYLTFFERLFALWHIVHMPLFLLMLVAAGIHIVAVHFY
jgi:hypothetical protein